MKEQQCYIQPFHHLYFISPSIWKLYICFLKALDFLSSVISLLPIFHPLNALWDCFLWQVLSCCWGMWKSHVGPLDLFTTSRVCWYKSFPSACHLRFKNKYNTHNSSLHLFHLPACHPPQNNTNSSHLFSVVTFNFYDNNLNPLLASSVSFTFACEMWV